MCVTWTTGAKGRWKGLVVGYNVSKTQSLVFYDDPTIGCERSIDYYTAQLVKTEKTKRKLNKFTLLVPKDVASQESDSEEI